MEVGNIMSLTNCWVFFPHSDALWFYLLMEASANVVF